MEWSKNNSIMIELLFGDYSSWSSILLKDTNHIFRSPFLSDFMPHKCIPSVIRIITWSVPLEAVTQEDRDKLTVSGKLYQME